MSLRESEGVMKNMNTIYELEIPIESELKKVYFTLLSIKIKKPEFIGLNFEEKLNLVLKLINEQRVKFDGFIQLFSLSGCAGLDHIKFALYHSLKNIYKNTMISNLPENEILLYLSIQRQISKAFISMGIQKSDFMNEHFEKGMMIISQNRNSIKEKINQLGTHYEIEPVSVESIKDRDLIIEKAKQYWIFLDQALFQDPQSLYNHFIARLNEKMIKLTIENVS